MTLTQAPPRRGTPRCAVLKKSAARSLADGNRAEAAVQQSQATACEAGLRFVSADAPGIARKRAGKSFKYIDDKGRPITDKVTIGRIKSLAIPPAWTDVWICPNRHGHIQAVGRDARGRKQYRYHPRWREVRDEDKYGKMIAFAKALPRIRARTKRDLKKKGLPRRKVLAGVIQLMEKTLIRVGNDEYAKNNKSYGLTTLRDRHAEVNGSKIRFEFKGKSGVEHDLKFSEPRLAKIIEHCQDLPGEELFQYVDPDGEVVDVGSQDVNDYLREIAGEEFTAKDFRTWAGTVLAAQALQELKTFDSQAEAKRNIVRAVEQVAQKLGNTKAVCRKCYIHPMILNAYMDGTLVQTLRQRAADMARSMSRLRPEEASVLSLLQRRLTEPKR
jgi:DNA topoisomerase-1